MIQPIAIAGVEIDGLFALKVRLTDGTQVRCTVADLLCMFPDRSSSTFTPQVLPSIEVPDNVLSFRKMMEVKHGFVRRIDEGRGV